MDYGTLACPAIRITAYGQNLTLELSETSDPKEDLTFGCKHLQWKKEKYLRDGQTCQPAAVSNAKTIRDKPWEPPVQQFPLASPLRTFAPYRGLR